MMDMTPSTVRRFEQRPKRTRYCQVHGCGTFTREGKAYCTEHVEHHEYIQHLLSVISSREVEERKVGEKGWRAVNIKGSISEEIIQFLKVHGRRTIARLARDLNRNCLIQHHYIEALKRAKLVRTRENKRGALIVSLV